MAGGANKMPSLAPIKTVALCTSMYVLERLHSADELTSKKTALSPRPEPTVLCEPALVKCLFFYMHGFPGNKTQSPKVQRLTNQPRFCRKVRDSLRPSRLKRNTLFRRLSLPHGAPIALGCTACDRLPRQTSGTLALQILRRASEGPTERAGIATVKCERREWVSLHVRHETNCVVSCKTITTNDRMSNVEDAEARHTPSCRAGGGRRERKTTPEGTRKFLTTKSALDRIWDKASPKHSRISAYDRRDINKKRVV